VWQWVFGHSPFLLWYKFNLIETFFSYYILVLVYYVFPSFGTLILLCSLLVRGEEYLKVSVLQRISRILPLISDLEMLCGVKIMFSVSPRNVSWVSTRFMFGQCSFLQIGHYKWMRCKGTSPTASTLWDVGTRWGNMTFSLPLAKPPVYISSIRRLAHSPRVCTGLIPLKLDSITRIRFQRFAQLSLVFCSFLDINIYA
jgi:hypothetical protein